jgi:hypothetical protein
MIGIVLYVVLYVIVAAVIQWVFHKLPATAYGLHRICADITCCSLRVSYRQQRRILAGDAAGVASGGFIGLVYRLRLSASIRAGYCRIIPTDIEAVYKF